MYDYKPELVKRDGQDCPQEFLAGRTFAFTSGTPKLMGTPRKFAQYGQSGTWLSDAVPNFHAADIVDEMCFIHSMNTDQFNHAPAELLIYTGSPRSGRPVVGRLGDVWTGHRKPEPARLRGADQQRRAAERRSEFVRQRLSALGVSRRAMPLEGRSGAVCFRSRRNGPRPAPPLARHACKQLNELQADELGHPETLTRIAQYELAFRMQASVPEVMDISSETQETLAAYGAEPGASSFANNCLLARRLVEQGVRYVQLFDWGWDFHGTDRRHRV